MEQRAIERISMLKPEAIIYISCNPAQLAKDIGKFRHYSLRSAALFDMFPQTTHAEVVAELART
jgi:23S rRNA (uracil1939-C5)-methyltransferase